MNIGSILDRQSAYADDGSSRHYASMADNFANTFWEPGEKSSHLGDLLDDDKADLLQEAVTLGNPNGALEPLGMLLYLVGFLAGDVLWDGAAFAFAALKNVVIDVPAHFIAWIFGIFGGSDESETTSQASAASAKTVSEQQAAIAPADSAKMAGLSQVSQHSALQQPRAAGVVV